MHVTIRYRLSEAGQKASILAGGGGASEQLLEVTSDSPEFARALEAATIKSDGTAVLNLTGWQNRSWDHVPVALEILDDLDARKAEEQAKHDAEAAKIEAETLAVLTERRTREHRYYEDTEIGNISIPRLVPDWPYETDKSVTESPEASAWQAELDVVNAAKKAAFITIMKAEAEAKKQAEAEAAEREQSRRAALGLQGGDDDFEVEQGALTQVPCWETHRRGKNWLAVISVNPAAPGGLDRKFTEKAKGSSYYILPEALWPGDALEFGADYISGGGNRSTFRWYGYVVRIDHEIVDAPGRLVLHKCQTGKQAVQEGKKFAAQIQESVQS